MTQEEIDQIKSELKEISPWPWVQIVEDWYSTVNTSKRSDLYLDQVCSKVTRLRDSSFIAKSPERISALIKEREESLQRIAQLEKTLLDKITEFGEVQGYNTKSPYCLYDNLSIEDRMKPLALHCSCPKHSAHS